MHLNIETLALLNGGQALVLALMLWFGTRDGSNSAVKGLRLRAGALLLEAGGDSCWRSISSFRNCRCCCWATP